ncbi:MAG: transcriptional regulator [Candidatus Diapherotrites archaeon]|nr:transcriptional regulator [Candidatus Diapherotrites archaeon]MDZ4256955.1 transcriptional regulator [archaeon]
MTFLIQAAETVTTGVAGNFTWLAIGFVFFIGAVLVLYFLKNIIVNTILGLIAWAILTYILQINLPFWASLIVSALFGLAGIGAMVVLAFLGIV